MYIYIYYDSFDTSTKIVQSIRGNNTLLSSDQQTRFFLLIDSTDPSYLKCATRRGKKADYAPSCERCHDGAMPKEGSSIARRATAVPQCHRATLP